MRCDCMNVKLIIPNDDRFWYVQLTLVLYLFYAAHYPDTCLYDSLLMFIESKVTRRQNMYAWL